MDTHILYFINNQLAHPSLDVFMAAFTSWAVWWPFLALTSVLALVFGNFQTRAMLLAVGLAVGMSDGLVCKNLKHLVGRPRPHQVLSGIRVVDLASATPRILAVALPLNIATSAPARPAERGNAFPSSHVANCFAIAMVCFLCRRNWGWIVFLPAALIGFSRMYVGVHWPSDVLAGSLIGMTCGLIVVMALRWLWRRFGQRLAPALYEAHPELMKS
jgi:undecaprenyl-diphosphatase